MANYTNMTGQLVSGLHNTISITGAQGSTANPWQNLTTGSISLSDLDWGIEPHVKKYQVLEIEEDLLALSCAWQRVREAHKKDPNNSYVPFTKLTDATLFKVVTQVDYDKAAQVRDYYSKKIMMWKLKEQKLTKFREDMNTFIHTDGKIFREDMQPLAYRLPEFYDYDTEFDSLTNEYNKKIVQSERSLSGTKELKLAKTFVVGKKYAKRKEYWFSDEQNDLVTLSVAFDNPLLSLLDICTKNPIRIGASFNKKYRDNHEYLEANKFKFI